MIESYRITKYGPYAERKNEWTSFNDIGKLVTKEQYELIESKYINTIVNISKCMGVDCFRISGLELRFEPYSYFENQLLDIESMSHVAMLVLREKLWCRLKALTCEFHFGYDYYMYFVSFVPVGNCLSCVEKGLFVDAFLSPYLVS